MEIIIVRHGLSEANKAGIVSGHLDTPLSKEGKDQAQKMAARLAGLKIDAIFSSPLKRAIDTALPLAEKIGTKVIVDRRLIELNWGDFESKPDADFIKVYGAPARDILDTYKYDFSEYGGETSEQVEARIKSFLEDLKKQPYQLVLVVCHGGVVRWLHYLITGEKITWQPNAEELHLKSN
jgi:broad specificity phosphatase PhoE